MEQHVLIVEDETALADMMQEALKEEGFCTEVVPGTDALAAAEATQPAVVLLDLMLPDVDGTEVGRRLRATPATAHIPIVVVSGAKHVRMAAGDVGATFYLEKPFPLDTLIATVKAYATLGQEP
jgi:DNA-binding response OmpR family regulator